MPFDSPPVPQPNNLLSSSLPTQSFQYQQPAKKINLRPFIIVAAIGIPVILFVGLLVSVFVAALKRAPVKSNPAIWETYTSTEGRYSVRIPGVRKLQEWGGETDRKTYGALSNRVSGYSFNVYYTDGSESNTDEERLSELRRHVDIMGQRMKCRVNSVKVTSFQGYPAIEFDFSGKEAPIENLDFTGKTFIANDRNYLLAVDYPRSNRPEKQIAAFYDSFTLLQAPPPKAVVQTWNEPWLDYASAEGRFRCKIPGVSEQKKTPIPRYDNTILQMVASHGVKTCTFMIIFYDLPPASKEDQIQRLVNEINDMCNRGQPIANKESTILGYPGREFEFVGDAGLVTHGRAFLENNRVYILTSTFQKGKRPEEEISKFYDSFKLLNE